MIGPNFTANLLEQIGYCPTVGDVYREVGCLRSGRGDAFEGAANLTLGQQF